MLFSLLLACVTEDNFWPQAGSLACQREEECNKGSFEDNYTDQADCRDEYESTVNDYLHCLDDCEFDVKAATEALKNYREASCNDRQFDVFDVYDCPSETEVAICIGLDAMF